jgi:glycosyltransferase involved in cell wall biosynthesis
MQTAYMNAPDHTHSSSQSQIQSQLDLLCDALGEMNELDRQSLQEYQQFDLIDSLELPVDFLLSLVVPVYNEKATIATVISKLVALPIRKEIVIVDDCSTDGTDLILDRLASLDCIQVYRSESNQGKGAALRTAFAHARGDIIVVQDADLEYDPKDIPRLLQPLLSDEADVVYGSRFMPDDTESSDSQRPQHRDRSWVHRFGNGFLTWASNLINGTELTDMETCYKAFRRDVLTDLSIKQDRFGIEPELTAKLARRGFRFTEVPISYNARGWDEGKKIGIKDLFQAFYCIGRYGFCD